MVLYLAKKKQFVFCDLLLRSILDVHKSPVLSKNGFRVFQMLVDCLFDFFTCWSITCAKRLVAAAFARG